MFDARHFPQIVNKEENVTSKHEQNMAEQVEMLGKDNVCEVRFYDII